MEKVLTEFQQASIKTLEELAILVGRKSKMVSSQEFKDQCSLLLEVVTEAFEVNIFPTPAHVARLMMLVDTATKEQIALEISEFRKLIREKSLSGTV